MTIPMLLVGVVAVLLVGCAPTPDPASATSAPAFVTATLPSLVKATATQPIEPAATTVPPTPIAGSTTTQINVRQEPLASGRVLGTLAASAAVEIFSRDPAENWYQIAHAAGDGGMGWVAAQYVKVPDASAVPLASISGGRFGSVREQINVRSGPGTQFDAVGLLSARDVVTLTGRDRTGAWLQIRYAAGADGKGWVAASFLEAITMDDLPIVTDTGEVLGTGTPVATGPSPTPAPAIARVDGDTAAAPAVDARFSPGGSGSVFFSSDLSAPAGDNSDWIHFTPYRDSITVRLDCDGSDQLAAEVLLAEDAIAGLPVLRCGTSHHLALQAGTTYGLHLSISPHGGEQLYVRYTVSLFAVPDS